MTKGAMARARCLGSTYPSNDRNPPSGTLINLRLKAWSKKSPVVIQLYPTTSPSFRVKVAKAPSAKYASNNRFFLGNEAYSAAASSGRLAHSTSKLTRSIALGRVIASSGKAISMKFSVENTLSRNTLRANAARPSRRKVFRVRDSEALIPDRPSGRTNNTFSQFDRAGLP